MRKVFLVIAALALVAAGCNQSVDYNDSGANQPQSQSQTSNSKSQTASGSSTSSKVDPDTVINAIDASVDSETKAAQGDDSDLFKSDSSLNNFSEVQNAQ
jgi:hypothetical protein